MKLLLFIFLSFSFLLFSTHITFAIGEGTDFGGTVISTPQMTNPAAQCPGISFSIKPAGSYPAGPYYTAVPTSTPTVGGGVLGKYTTSEGPCCIPSADGCNPITTYVTTVVAFGGSVSSFGNLSIPSSYTGGGPGFSPSIAGGGTGGGAGSTGRQEEPGATDDAPIDPLNLGPSTLKKGSFGVYVKNLQTNLNTYWGASLTVDGGFGVKTETAVKLFQKNHTLIADGVVGKLTKAALVSNNSGYTGGTSSW